MMLTTGSRRFTGSQSPQTVSVSYLAITANIGAANISARVSRRCLYLFVAAVYQSCETEG